MHNKRFFRALLCTVLIAAALCAASGCHSSAGTPVSVPGASSTQLPIVKGEGSTVFTFVTADLAGNETVFEIHTDAATVGAALQQVGLIEGESGPYGLYVKKVNGILLDYDTHGKYWSFSVNGHYAAKGADQTDIVPSDVYAFVPAS